MSRLRLLLTGPPGVGKTTVLRRLVERLGSLRIAGFLTEEIREGGERRGFRAVPFGGEARVIAHVSFPAPRVGRYGVDVATVDALAHATLETPGADLYVVDEIGKMECLSPRFTAAMRRLLDSPAPLVAAVSEKGSGLIADVKRRPAVELVPVTRANRDPLPERLAARVFEGTP